MAATDQILKVLELLIILAINLGCLIIHIQLQNLVIGQTLPPQIFHDVWTAISTLSLKSKLSDQYTVWNATQSILSTHYLKFVSNMLDYGKK